MKRNKTVAKNIIVFLFVKYLRLKIKRKFKEVDFNLSQLSFEMFNFIYFRIPSTAISIYRNKTTPLEFITSAGRLFVNCSLLLFAYHLFKCQSHLALR